MRYLIPATLLMLAGCPGAQNNVPMAETKPAEVTQTVHERLIAALEKGNGRTLNRGEVARAWRSVTDEEWDSWDTNNDDVLDRGEIAKLTDSRQ